MRALHVAILFAAALGPAQAGEWKTHAFERDGFAAEFSGNVDVDPMDTTKRGYERFARITTYTQMSKDGHVGYLVSVNRYRDGEDFNFSALARRTMKSYDCQNLTDDIRLDIAGAQVREMRATQCYKGTRIAARFFRRGPWFYQVAYLITDDADRADAERFLASFKLTPVKD